MLARIACLFRFHSWSAYAHIPSRCVDERFCKACNTTQNVLRHRYGKWETTTQNINGFVNGEVVTTGQYTVQRRWCGDCNFVEFAKGHA